MQKLLIFIFLASLFGCQDIQWTEDETWSRIGKFRSEEQTDSLGFALDYYVEHFSEGKYISEVQTLKTTFDEETEEWEKASKRGCTVEQIDAFLNRYPAGFYRQQALSAIDSLSFRSAQEQNSVTALEDYLLNFPEGKFAQKAKAMIDGTEERSVTSDERRLIADVIKSHFACMTEGDEDGITNTMAENISCYIGKKNCTQEYVLEYMGNVNSDYKTKVMEAANFNIRKIGVAGIPVFNVQFHLTETINPEDTLNCEERQFNGTAIVNSHMKITSLILE